MLKKTLFILFVVLLSGCNSLPKPEKYYSGPDRNEKELSVFSFWLNQEFRGEFASYAKIYPKTLNGKEMPNYSTFSVLPNSYELVVGCEWNKIEFNHTYNITTIKGKNYAIVIDVKEDKCVFRDLTYVSEKEGFTKI